MPITYTDYQTGAQKVLYPGRVLADRERNYHDDSDFYALVLTEDGKLITTEYATTRFSSDGSCQVDATPEVVEQANRAAGKDLLKLARKQMRTEAAYVEEGKTCKVVRGRKIKQGTVVRVLKIATIQTGYSAWTKKHRALVALDEEMVEVQKVARNGRTYTFLNHRNVAWTDTGNLEVLDPQRYWLPESKLAEYTMRATFWDWLSATSALAFIR